MSELRARDFARSIETLRSAMAEPSQRRRSDALKAYYYPNASAKYEYALVFVNWIVAAGMLIPILRGLAMDGSLAMHLLVAVPLAFFCADFMSALFHKFLDSYAQESNRIYGTAARAFRIHHEFPQNLNETTYLHNVSAFAPFMSVLYGLLIGTMFAVALPSWLALAGWLMILLFANGTEIHKQAHRRNVGWLAGSLQATGFFLGKARHIKHHVRDHNSDYGIINGWSNGVLNYVGAWRALDRFAWRKLKLFPRNWIHDPSSIPEDVVIDLASRPDLVPREIAIYLSLFPHRARGAYAQLLGEPKKPSERMLAR